MSFTSFKYQLLPNPTAQCLGTKTAGACRWLWNWALDYRGAMWLAAKSAGATGLCGSLGWVHLCSLLVELKREYPWLAEVPSHTLQQTMIDLDRAFEGFFSGKKGYPKFRRKDDPQSFRFPDPKAFAIDKDWVKLPKFGWVRFNLSRPIIGTIKNITVTQENEEWFISFCCEGEYRLPNYGVEGVGIDAGVSRDLTLSNGDVLSIGAPSDGDWEKLARLQQSTDRKTIHSNRWKKAQGRVSRQYKRMANRRRDQQHKISHELATQHSFVALEDLNLKAMTKSAAGTIEAPGKNVTAKSSLNREMLARGFGVFKKMLRYKCERANIPFVLVNPAFTSQTCSQCHHCAPENRKNQAAFRCVACGHEENADVNAARNIKSAGHAEIARQYSDLIQKKTRTHPKDPSVTGLPGILIEASCLDREDVNWMGWFQQKPLATNKNH